MADKVEPFWKKSIPNKEIPKNKTEFDIIIVGGGPAGCASACYAVKEGYKVLLLEKEEYPRDKICGDAVGGKSLKHLDELKILDTFVNMDDETLISFKRKEVLINFKDKKMLDIVNRFQNFS